MATESVPTDRIVGGRGPSESLARARETRDTGGEARIIAAPTRDPK